MQDEKDRYSCFRFDWTEEELEFIVVQVGSPNINHTFDAEHPDYFRLSFSADSVIESLSISYSITCDSDVYEIGMCFSPIWSDGVIDGDRDLFMVSPSLFHDADYHQIDYDNLNSRYYVFFPSVEIGIYPY